VRRKVARLIDRGWVERLESGHLRVTNRVVEDLAPITRLTLVYFDELERLMTTND
jgi:hypothetical protein